MKVPLVDLVAQHALIGEEVMAAARAVIESQTFVLGEPVARFERTLAEIAGTEHAVGVGSGTDALVLALRAMGVGAGDAVITASLTFVATVEAIVAVGARPLFADVDPGLLTLAPESVASRLERARARGEKVRAVVPVHLFGQCADMTRLRVLARDWSVVLVEDAAQAIGARDGDGIAGGMGEAGCFSFFPSKNLGGWGDGGAVTTSDPGVARRVRSLRQHGMVAPDCFAERGMNSRLDALQAAVLDVKARHLEEWTRSRRDVAARYRAMLAGLDALELPHERAGSLHVYHQFAVRTPRRAALAAFLAERGVDSRAYYARPIHEQPAYAPDEAEDLQHTEAASREILALPMYAELPVASQAYVCDAIRAFFA